MSRETKRKRVAKVKNRINKKNFNTRAKDKVRLKKATVSRTKKIEAFKIKLQEKYKEFIEKLYTERTKDSK